MYESFYHLTEKPFTLLPDPGFLYLSDKHRMALTLLEYGLMNQAGFTVISGEIGTGKTTLIRYLLDHMDREHTVGLISNTHRDFGELLQWILLAFNLDHKNMNKVEMYQRLVDFIIEEYAHNRRVVIIVDEAQNMAAETLEELRMLSNINADKDQTLQVILAGQRELRDTLRRPDLVQFAQRISVDYHLEPLSEVETMGYIHHRLEVAGGDPELFETAACQAVHRFSNGIPRLINLLCDTALVYGFAEQLEHIDSKLINDVAREKQQGGIFPVYAEPGPAEPRKPAAQPKSPAAAADPVATPKSGQTPESATPARVAPVDVPPVTTPPTGRASGKPATPVSPEPGARPAAQVRRAAISAAPNAPHPVTVKPATATGPETRVKVSPNQYPPQPVTDSKPVPVLEPAKETEAAKKKLHVALCSVNGDLLDYLSRLLENHGHEVVSKGPLSISQLDTLDPDDIDVLVISINEDKTYVPSPLKRRLVKWPGPIYYSNSTAVAVSQRQGDTDFGRLLSERLVAVAEAAPASTGAVS